jgi:hypothetical protein
MENKIKKLISDGNFLKAKKLVFTIDYASLRNVLLSIGYDEEDI